jgi:inner membrane protein
MSPVIHGLVAWILAILLIKDVRDRRLVVIAGVIPDIDAIFLLLNEDLFYEFHHTIGHSFVFGIPLALLFAAVSRDTTANNHHIKQYQSFPSRFRARVFLACLGTFSLHLLADYYGSNWPVPLFWPFSGYEVTAAEFISYQTMYGIINPVVAALTVLIVIILIFVKESTPLEFISKKLDDRLVGFYVYPIKYRCHQCPTLALFACEMCGEKACWEHMGSIRRWGSWKCGNCDAKDTISTSPMPTKDKSV